VSSPIPFADLAPDARTLRGLGELTAFDFQTATEVGLALRALGERGSSTQLLADQLVNMLNGFEHDARPACVLVRAFVTRVYRDLPEALQASLTAANAGRAPAPEQLCLQLVATRGIEPAWNDTAQSSAHRAVLLGGAGEPMLAELESQLRIGDLSQPATGTFHIADAVASPAVPAKNFVRSYGVRSVFGFGARAWPGETVIVIAFSRIAVDRKLARMLNPVALYTRVAWLGSGEAHARLDGLSHSRAWTEAHAQLVAWHETALRESLTEQRSLVAASRAEARQAAEHADIRAERHNKELRRTQRAMLNVIEDLRAAREALETTVERRTRELGQANRQLESRNRELEEFVYIASHDLQEPLRTVSGYLQIIERRYAAKLGPEGDEFIRFAIEGAQRMQALIESLLVYARVTTTERRFESVPLHEPLESALRNLALRIEETHASIERCELPTIRADRIQMVQLFQNLLSNALKFAGDQPPRVQISARLEGNICRLEVRDWGIGFQAKFADRIFKVFRRLQRDTEGTGIGLAVCKKIAERHGGRITAEAAPGQGATFTIELAIEPEQRGWTGD
jgi:signal transduction histidine kinase